MQCVERIENYFKVFIYDRPFGPEQWGDCGDNLKSHVAVPGIELLHVIFGIDRSAHL
jgi:hypothetical protein